jgi:hypothetical protein
MCQRRWLKIFFLAVGFFIFFCVVVVSVGRVSVGWGRPAIATNYVIARSYYTFLLSVLRIN